MKRMFIAIAVLVLLFGLAASSPAEEKTAPKTMPSRPPMMPNFTMVFGSVTKISDMGAGKSMLEVKSDADNKVHLIEVLPQTSVTKVTDISEIKEGNAVRVMTRKVAGKEVAMGVMFGKIKNLPPARPVARPAAEVKK